MEIQRRATRKDFKHRKILISGPSWTHHGTIQMKNLHGPRTFKNSSNDEGTRKEVQKLATHPNTHLRELASYKAPDQEITFKTEQAGTTFLRL